MSFLHGDMVTFSTYRNNLLERVEEPSSGGSVRRERSAFNLSEKRSEVVANEASYIARR